MEVRSMRRLVAAIIVLFGTAGYAPCADTYEDVMSAGTLHSFCNSTDSNTRRICSIYILGVSQGIGVGAGSAKDKEHFCIPDDLSESQMVAIFQKWANRLFSMFPNDMNLPAV